MHTYICIDKHTQHMLFSLNNTPNLQQAQIILLITFQIKHYRIVHERQFLVIVDSTFVYIRSPLPELSRMLEKFHI